MAKVVTPAVPGAAPTSGISDGATRQAMQPLVDAHATRNNPVSDDGFVTRGELKRGGQALVEAGLSDMLNNTPPSGQHGLGSSPWSELFERFKNSIFESQTWRKLSKELTWLDESNNRVVAKLKAMGAGIESEQTIRRGADEALVESVNAVFASIGMNGALAYDQDIVIVNWTSAEATKFSQLQAEVFGTDGTPIRAALAQESEARVSLEDGISTTYTVRMEADGRWAGFALGLNGQPGAVQSEFIIAADRFAIVQPGNPNDIPRIPFGIDEFGNTFINGTLLVNAGGPPLSDSAQKTALVYAYKRAAAVPTDNPGAVTYSFSSKSITTTTLLSGWQKTIPNGTDPLWVTVATAQSSSDIDNIAATEWSTPSKLAQDGAEGKGVSSISETYQRHTSGTAAPTGTWSTSIPALNDTYKYLWKKEVVTYTDDTTDMLYSMIGQKGDKGDKGDTGSAGATGPRGTAIGYGTSATDANFMSSTGLPSVIVGDQMIVSTSGTGGGTSIYKRTQSGWSNSTAFYVNGNAVINGTLYASTLTTKKVVISPIGSYSGTNVSVTNGAATITFSTSSAVSTPIWSYAIEPPNGTIAMVYWVYNTISTVSFGVRVVSVNGAAPYTGTIPTLNIWMF